MLSSAFASGILFFASAINASPLHSFDSRQVVPSKHVSPRADSSLVGYLGAFFLGDDPYVYFYLSNGNDPISFSALNDGSPILEPTVGTGGVRDPAIVTAGGTEAGNKWYIIGTDLDISKTTWDASERTGSLGILVWESTDLVTWTNERLVAVENSSAGMVWAPEALWDADQGQYLVHWASKFYDADDTDHTGTSSAIMIRYAYTSDFETFTTPQTYIDYSPYSTIDLDILALDDGTYVRFMKNESASNVFSEYSTEGLFGSWTRVGGSGAIIQSSVEGPAAYLDNEVDGKAHVLLDFYSSDGYHPYESTSPTTNSWTASDRTNFPTGLRHGSVLPVNQTIYDALSAAWS